MKPTSRSPYMARTGGRIGETGRKSEDRTAKRLNALKTPASGATGAKGDMDLGDFKIEAKSTVKWKAPFSYSEVCKIKHEAIHAGKHPAIAVTFVAVGSGRPRKDGRWILIEEDVFKELVDGSG